MKKAFCVKGALLGILLFGLTLFYVVYLQSRYGLPTGFSVMLSVWWLLAVYLVACLLVGCLLYLIASFIVDLIVSFIRRRRANPLPYQDL